MELKQYIKSMVLVAIPLSFAGAFLAMMSTHSGGILLFISKLMLPGLFLVDFFDKDDSIGLFLVILINAQIIYCSVLVTIYYKYKNNAEA